MIDGIKIRVHGPAMERLRAHHLLTFTEGDQLGVFTATWGAYTITGNERIAWHITGSIHCDYHGGENWRDFNRAMFGAAVDHLCGSLGLHDAALTIEGLEFGVNVIPPDDTGLILDSVKSHRRAIAKRMGGPDAVGLVIAHEGVKKKRPNYRWKIYDKAHHYGLPGQLLRVELAYRQTATIRAMGIRTLADLRTGESWVRLAALLLTRFDELHIVEPYTDTAALRPAQVAIVALAEQPHKWVKLTGAQLCRKAKALEHIYTLHASPRIRPALRELIHAKLHELNTTGDAIPVTESQGVCLSQPVMKSPGGLEQLPVTESSLMIKSETITGKAEGLGKARKMPAEAFGLPAEVVSVASSRSDLHKEENDARTPQRSGEFLESIKRNQPEEFFQSTKEAATSQFLHSTKGAAESKGVPGPPCATCGRPTGSTRKSSKFCAPSFYGLREAKKCRNADSNPRHNPKTHRARSLAKIMSGGVLFDQSAYIRPAR